MVHFIPQKSRKLVLLASQADEAPVLIYGASGTGKEAICKWIHNHSARSSQPFVTSIRNKPLSVQLPQAQGGTLLISDLGERGLAEQRILLEYLSTKAIPNPANPGLKMIANVRIMACTSQALEGRAQAGMFNAQLLERLNVFRLEMPPLIKRMDEFEDIAIGLMIETARELKKDHVRAIQNETFDQLKSYDWPGNLRELRNVLRIAVVNCQTDTLTPQDLPDFGHDQVDFRTTREQFEKIYLSELLKTYEYNLDRTCLMTRIDRTALEDKIKKYGLNADTSVANGT